MKLLADAATETTVAAAARGLELLVEIPGAEVSLKQKGGLFALLDILGDPREKPSLPSGSEFLLQDVVRTLTF
jgi:hypothetical protein